VEYPPYGVAEPGMHPGTSFLPKRRAFDVLGLLGDVRIQDPPGFGHVSAVPFVQGDTVNTLE